MLCYINAGLKIQSNAQLFYVLYVLQLDITHLFVENAIPKIFRKDRYFDLIKYFLLSLEQIQTIK